MKITPVSISRYIKQTKQDLEDQVKSLEKRLITAENKLKILNAIERIKETINKMNNK